MFSDEENKLIGGFVSLEPQVLLGKNFIGNHSLISTMKGIELR